AQHVGPLQELIGMMLTPSHSGPGSDCQLKRNGNSPHGVPTNECIRGATNGRKKRLMPMELPMASCRMLDNTRMGHLRLGCSTWSAMRGSGRLVNYKLIPAANFRHTCPE